MRTFNLNLRTGNIDDREIEIDGLFYSGKVVHDILKFMTSPRKHPLCIMSESGCGKSFTISNMFRKMHKDVTGRTCSVVFGTPSKLKNTRDLFETTTFRNNSQEWIITWYAKNFVDTAQDLYPVIEEASRIDPDSQNILLDLLEEKQTILLQNLGKTITLPANSRVILLANPSGGGVFPLNGVILDRVKIVTWELPSVKVLAKQIFSRFDYVACNYSYKGICVNQQQIDLYTVEAIINSVYVLKKQIGFHLSYRMLEKLVAEYIQDSNNFISYLSSYLCELSEESDASTYAIMRELQNLENKLYNDNDFRQTGTGY